MRVFVKIAAICSALLAATPLNAGIAFVTADGTWDCKDDAGAGVAAVVVADTRYALMGPDGNATGYGDLKQVAQADVDLPTFVVLGGPLKDQIGAIAMTMRGPRGNKEDTSGDLFLNLIISESNLIECTKRMPLAT